jgi:hypothetical protein
MTFMEKRMLDLFRKCDDDKKFALLELADICVNPVPAAPVKPQATVSSPDPARIQTSIERISKYAAGNIPLRYDLATDDLAAIHEMIHQGTDEEYRAISMIFDYGFVMGNRATRRGKVKAL